LRAFIILGDSQLHTVEVRGQLDSVGQLDSGIPLWVCLFASLNALRHNFDFYPSFDPCLFHCPASGLVLWIVDSFTVCQCCIDFSSHKNRDSELFFQHNKLSIRFHSVRFFSVWVFAIAFFYFKFFHYRLFTIKFHPAWLFAIGLFFVWLFTITFLTIGLFAIGLFAISFFPVWLFTIELFTLKFRPVWLLTIGLFAISLFSFGFFQYRLFAFSFFPSRLIIVHSFTVQFFLFVRFFDVGLTHRFHSRTGTEHNHSFIYPE
jgi:hypothetical protein